MDRLELAGALRHYGLEAIKLAADIEASEKGDDGYELPLYAPRFEVENGVEAITNRLSCCGAGPDQRDARTGERLHLIGCRRIGRTGLASCRDALGALA